MNKLYGDVQNIVRFARCFCMQAPTHILVGSILQQLFKGERLKPIRYFLLAITAFLLHGIFDKIAKMTYHPPNANFADAFWVLYHISVLLTTIVFVYIWGKEYSWGIVFSLLPDLDWVFIHGQKMAGINLDFYNTPHLHNTLHMIIDSTLGIINQLPDLRFYGWACLLEIALLFFLITVLRSLEKRRRNIHF